MSSGWHTCSTREVGELGVNLMSRDAQVDGGRGGNKLEMHREKEGEERGN